MLDIFALTEGINDTATQQEIMDPCEPFAFFIYNENHKVIAGTNGYLVYGAIYTGQLWVSESLRGQGIGRKLMEKVHEYGGQKGCTIATLRTMSFQNARPLYEKLGYECHYEETGYTQGHRCFYMKRVL
jgi:GNAT superfamily N-acetyltransferase